MSAPVTPRPLRSAHSLRAHSLRARSLQARSLQPEILDELAPEDPEAQRSRRDLRRVNRLMGACGIIRRALRATATRASGAAPLRLLEIGAGDGELMLRVARSLALRGQQSRGAHVVELQLLDRQGLVSRATLEAYARAGWQAQPLVCDVRDWVAAAVSRPRYDAIVANLFLHHFAATTLKALLAAAAARCECFIACEPRRSTLALLGSHLLGAIGANRVTRHDAVLSVRAGFHNHELADHWPERGWQIEERAAGLFSHLFVAWRNRADAI